MKQNRWACGAWFVAAAAGIQAMASDCPAGEFRMDTVGGLEGRVVRVTSLIYNPGRAVIRVGFPQSEWKGRPMPAEGRASVVGNVLIAGANTRSSLSMIAGTGEVDAEDNLAQDRDGQPRRVLDPQIRALREKPVWPSELQVLPSREVVDFIVRTVGVRPWQRDPIDQRIVDSVVQRTGRIIDSQDEIGGYPVRKATRRTLETIPDGAAARRQWLDRIEETH